MTNTRIALGLALVIAAVWATRGGAQGTALQVPTFRGSADVVSVDVSVRDGSRVITDLSADSFEVFDNGVPQQVTDASYGTLPIDVTVALDVSFSVTGSFLDQLRRAVRGLMRDLKRGDRLKLILFNMRVTRVVDFTTDIEAIEAAILDALPGGGSSIWDAVAVALVSATAVGRRQLVVLFSDAADSTSTMRPEALFDVAQRTNAALGSVLPGGSLLGRPAVGSGADLLRRLAAETGGTQLRAAASQNLDAAFRRVLDEFRSSYVLHYAPAGVERGGFHTLEVRVKGRTGFIVRARRGYFWR